MRIVGPVWKEWWREVLAGWRRNEMSCLVGGCNRICNGRYWPAKPETMVLDAAKYAPRVFASGKPKLQKSIWRLTGWPLWLVNGNGRCWPAGAEKECADGLEAWGSGRKQRCRLLENVHFVFSRLKNSRLLFFVCRLNFILLFSAAGAEFPGKTRHKR